MKYAYIKSETDTKEVTRFGVKKEDILIGGKKDALDNPKFKEMLKMFNEGDEIYFSSPSDISRKSQSIIKTVEYLQNNKKIKVYVPIAKGMNVGEYYTAVLLLLCQRELEECEDLKRSVAGVL